MYRGYCFAPRIKDLKERKLYAIEKPDTYPLLKPLIGDAVDTAALVRGWAELMRVRASIEAGVVAPSAILRKLAAAGSNNALSRALRAVGRIERTLFTLQWLSDPALCQRSHAGLNKGEASNSLRRAVFFHRQGEFRDRTFENQSFRAELADGSHRPLEHDLSRPCRPAPPRPGRRYLQRTARPRRAARLGAHRAHGRVRLERRKADQRFAATPGCCRRVPAPRRLACSFEQTVR